MIQAANFMKARALSMGTVEEELGLRVGPKRLGPRKEQGNSSGILRRVGGE